MEKYETLDNWIKEKDIRKLRYAVGGICYTSRDFSNGELEAAITYVVEDNGISLWQEYDEGELISEKKSTYTEDDFSTAVLELQENFCRKRIGDVQKIGKALYGNKPKPNQTNDAKRQSTTPSHNGENTNQKPTGTNPNQASQSSGARMGVLAVIIIAIIVAVVKLLK